MTTAKATREFLSAGLNQTLALGQAIGREIAGPLVITLTGDLASGKTALVQGLARGLEVPKEYYITSPSYTLVNEYPGRIPLCHADLYRLGDRADIMDTGLEEMLDQPIVLAIEWPAPIGGYRFENHLSIHIRILAKDTRRFEMTAYGLPAVNLLKQIKK